MTTNLTIRSLNRWRAGLLAALLVAASTSAAWAQQHPLFDHCGPGDTICVNTIFFGVRCEPVETAWARSLCPLPRQQEQENPPQEEEQPPPPPRQRQVAPPQPQQQRQPAPPQQQPPRQAAAPHLINPKVQHQIQPLNCPRGFAKVGETFYGGTKCAPVSRSSQLTGSQSGQPRPGRKPSSEVHKLCVGNDGIIEDCSYGLTGASVDRFGNHATDIEHVMHNLPGSTNEAIRRALLTAGARLPWDWVAQLGPVVRDVPAPPPPKIAATSERTQPAPPSQPGPASTQSTPPEQGSPPAASPPTPTAPVSQPTSNQPPSGQPTSASQPAAWPADRADVQKLQLLFLVTSLIQALTVDDDKRRVHPADVLKENILKALAEAEKAKKQQPKPQDPSLGINPW